MADLEQFLAGIFQPGIKIYVLPGGRMPERGSAGAGGFDVFARVIQDEDERDPSNRNLRLPLWELMGHDGEKTSYLLKPRESVLVGIGFVMEMPLNISCLFLARSGHTSRKNRSINIINSPSLIDSDFRGEAGVRLENQSRQVIEIESGMKIGQIVFLPSILPSFVSVASLNGLTPTARGGAGLGSTGMFAKKQRRRRTLG